MIWQGSFMSLKKQSSSRRRLTGISILKRNLAENNIQRARNPVTPSRMTVRGQFPSKKMQRMVAWESQLERRACYLFEFSPSISAFREQPRTFILPYKDKVKRYTPDFEVVYSNNSIQYYEVKPLKKLQELKHYFAYISQFLERENYGFSVLTEEELINPAREKNLTLMRSYQTRLLDDHVIKSIHLLLASGVHSLILSDVIDYFESESVVYALIAQGYLMADLSKPLTSELDIYFSHSKDLKNDYQLFTRRIAPDF